MAKNTMLNDVNYVKADYRQLTLNDRCDRCSSAALVRAVKNDMTLLFCGHHANESISNLIAKNWKIDDQTNRVFTNRLIDDETNNARKQGAMKPSA